jgi:hypothetical protein
VWLFLLLIEWVTPMQWLSDIFRRLRFGKSSAPMLPGYELATPSAADAPGERPGLVRIGEFESGPTLRIGSKKAAKLAWPARDQHRNSPQASDTREPAMESVPPDDEPTRLVGDAPEQPKEIDWVRKRNFPSPTDQESTTDDEESMTHLVLPDDLSDADPVVGWLVVVQGPGKGQSLEIGIGANSIGRAPSQQVSLNFGDQEISRERHAVIVYDPLSKRFFLQSGEVRNLTYANGEVVLGHAELSGGETIVLGKTHLRFVPFCGPNFSWS